jgi:hypothetical protein
VVIEESPSPSSDPPDDAQILGLALDHAWKWYELRSSHVMQIINFYLVSIAVLSAGYVSALGSRLRIIAGMVGLMGVAVTTVAFLAARRYDETGKRATDPLAELQGRLADALDVQSFRLVERHRMAGTPWHSVRRISRIVYVFAILACLTAAAFGFWAR